MFSFKNKTQNSDGSYRIPNKYLINDIFKEYNDNLKGLIPYELGIKLEELYNDDTCYTLIHRTQLDIEFSSNEINNIFEYGLINNYGIDYENTLTKCNSFPFYIYQLVSAFLYKQNSCKGSIIVKIPKELLDNKENLSTIYYENNGKYFLLPEYVVGYIPTDNGKLSTIYFNPNYINKNNEDTMKR